MIRSITFVLITLLFPLRVFANCELSWVYEWNQDRNWFHTTALYSDGMEGEKGRLPNIKQIKTSEHTVTVRCHSYNTNSCDDVVSLTYAKKRCMIDSRKTALIQGQADGFDSVVRYARTTLNNCLAESQASRLAILQSEGNLHIPEVHTLTLRQSNHNKTWLNTHLPEILKIESLRAVQYHYEKTVDVRAAQFELTHFYNDQFGNKVIYLNASLFMSNDNGLCAACNVESPIKKLPLMVGYINDNWLLIGNGHIDACSGYRKGVVELSKKMDIPFELPKHIIFYDIDGDNNMDLLSFTPRHHFPGTQYVYALLNNRLIHIAELCTLKDHCRPGAGC